MASPSRVTDTTRSAAGRPSQHHHNPNPIEHAAGTRVNYVFGERTSPKLRRVRDGLDVIGFPPDLLRDEGREADSEIYTMRPDGTDVRQLTLNDARDWFPAWSP